MKDKHLTLRLPITLYNQYVKKAIRQARTDKRIITVSEIIRKTLEDGI